MRKTLLSLFNTMACVLHLWGQTATAGGAHVHGQAHMTVVLDGKKLLLTATMAGHDLVGFEHQPTDHDEVLLVESAVNKLQNIAAWLTIVGGDCSVSSAQVDQPSQAHDSHHADFELSTEFNCQSPTALAAMVVKLNQQFTQLKRTEVQWLVHNKQGLSVLQEQQEEVSFQ